MTELIKVYDLECNFLGIKDKKEHYKENQEHFKKTGKVEKKVKISYTFNDLIFAYKVIFNEVDILQKEYKRRKEETYKKSEVILEEMSAELGISVGSIRSKIYNKQRG